LKLGGKRIITRNLVFCILAGILILIEGIIIGKYYKKSSIHYEQGQYSFLPLTTLINVGLVILGLFFNMYNDFMYGFVILIGMSIGLVGDYNNVSINESTQCFLLGSILFIISYLSYSLALLYTSGGFLFPVDILVIGLALLIYCILLGSTWSSQHFQSLGKFKVITLFYPIMLLFLLSRAIVNLIQSSLPLLSVVILTAGLLFIFISDMEFSLNKFFKPLDKMIGPLLYPLGQLAIALSTIMLPV
jgi:hypothetical protein